MPLQKQIRSLSQTCLLVVASQLANYDPKVNDDEVNSSNHDEEKPVTMKRITPFDQWPNHFVEQVIEALKTQGLLNIKHYDLLMKTRKLSLDLISRGFEDTNSFFNLLQLAADCCTEITVLNFGLFKMHLMRRALFYQQFLPQFTNLEVLSVAYSHGNFDDSCLHLLGTHCTSLRKLDVRGCHVTNSGIEELCGANTDLRIQDELMGHKGQCKSLQILLIAETQITEEGIQRALYHLPHLEVLSFDPEVHEIENLADMHRNGIARPEYALTRLSLSPNSRNPFYVPYSVGDLPLVASLCPFVTHVYIGFHNVRITDSELLGLKVLKKLTELHLEVERGYGDYEILITFDGGLAPVLESVGSSLKSLELRNLSIAVRLEKILEFCPILEHLLLDCCTYSTLTNQGDEQGNRLYKQTKTHLQFNKDLKELILKELILREPDRLVFGLLVPDDHSVTPQSLLFALCSSRALKKLVFSNCIFLDDAILQEAFSYHSFLSLEELDFSYCSFVTKKGIDIFMTENNPLKSLKFVDCDYVYEIDVKNWNMMGQENNWNFEASLTYVRGTKIQFFRRLTQHVNLNT